MIMTIGGCNLLTVSSIYDEVANGDDSLAPELTEDMFMDAEDFLDL